MNEETKLLREALQGCCTVLSGIRQVPLELAAYDSRNVVIDLVLTQAVFALNMTSERLPEGYSIYSSNGGRYTTSHLVDGLRYPIQVDGKEKYFYSEFKARMFCWEHFQRQEIEA